jgi:hypothetical protein
VPKVVAPSLWIVILVVVATTRADLLVDIQRGALEPTTNIADLLRKCLALGSELGSQRLQQWATRELKGYKPEDEFPPYRLASSPLYLDGSTLNAVVTGQQVPYNMIPDVARDSLNEPILIAQPLAELADIVASHRQRGENSVKLLPPLAQELVALINHALARADQERLPFTTMDFPHTQVVERVYWVVGLNVYASIMDTVRTTLVELVAEIKTASPQEGRSSTREAAEQAVEVAVYGKVRRLVVNQVGHNAAGAASAGGTANTGSAEPESKPRKLMWWLVGLAGLVGAAAAVAALVVHG